MPEELMDDLDEFTCAMYAQPRVKSVNEVRLNMLLGKCGKEDGSINPSQNFHMTSLSPCRQCLEQHIKRANYQVGIWKQANIPDPVIPNPVDGHGWTLVDGNIEPLWTDGDVLPQQLTDILEGTMNEAAEDDENEGEDVELEEDMFDTDEEDSDSD